VKSLALALVVAALAGTAAPVLAGSAQGFSFGRTGGNIRPLAARISAGGHVVVDGQQVRTLTQAQLRSLRELLVRERFPSLPAHIACRGALPDVATRHVTAAAKTVSVHGGCSGRFDRVYAALARAAGVA
jgi:hypothetical protein